MLRKSVGADGGGAPKQRGGAQRIVLVRAQNPRTTQYLVKAKSPQSSPSPPAVGTQNTICL